MAEANLRTATVKTYAVNDPWPKYVYRVVCGNCGALLAESAKGMGYALSDATGHVC